MKKVFTILLVSMIAFSMGFGQNNYADVSGVVTDIKGNPLPDLTVFVPFTSIGTTTNIKGEYSLSRLIPGKIELVFRHVAYKALSKTILAESNESIKLDVSLEENTIELAEIVKRADPANWELGWEKFKTHVLGDQMGRYCKVSNPKDLYFYYDGERLTGHATKPLEIINNYLGYKLVYFLDYFWLQEGKLLPDDLAPKTTFA